MWVDDLITEVWGQNTSERTGYNLTPTVAQSDAYLLLKKKKQQN